MPRALRRSVAATLFLATAFGLAIFSGASGSAAGGDAGKKRSNILFVILDDVGVDQLSLFGFGGPLPAKTPNLDLIAARGVMFTNMWAMPECSPSRAAFFTGRYPIRTGVTSAIVDNHLPQEYVSSFEATIPRVLETVGYESALIGKYHLGNAKDPAGNCAPSTRGWDAFAGNMTAGPPSIDLTAGGLDPSGGQVCGYYQGHEGGACYTRASGGGVSCAPIAAGNSAPGTSPSRTCLQAGGVFRPNQACGTAPPSQTDFDASNAYYVWQRFVDTGAKPPLSLGDCSPSQQSRDYMTTAQSVDAASWWNAQRGPRMLTLSFNAMHTPFQKAPTGLVPDPVDAPTTCNSGLPPRSLLNSIIEGADVEIGRTLARIGLATLTADGRQIATLDLKDTVLVIVGDNGSYGSTVRVADGFDTNRAKATVYQGGVWVPLIVAGPVVKSPGRKVDDLVNATDLFSLFGEVAGIDVGSVVPPSRRLDAKPMLPYLAAEAKKPIRTTSFAQVAGGKFDPDPAERSWPCQIASTCNDTLLFDQSLCEDNGGTWYGPGAAVQQTSCCAVAAANPSANITIIPPAQYAVRNKRYKLVELDNTDCSKPLAPGEKGAYPWAEYGTTTVREFYDIAKGSSANPNGMDPPENNLLAACPAGSSPQECLPKPVAKQYSRLAKELKAIRQSAEPQATCQRKGDGNLDLFVNEADVEAYGRFRGLGPSRYDINLDGETDEADLKIIRAHQGLDCLDVCVRADLNRDGRVDSLDMGLLDRQSGRCEANLCGGDLDGDQRVDRADVRLMLDAQQSCGAGERRARGGRDGDAG